MSRSTWITLLVTLVIGIGVGLYVGWVVSPVQYTDTAPDSLAPEYKDEIVLMLAVRYAGDGNLEAARAGLRLWGLADANVADVALRFIAAQKPEADIRRLAALAAALGAAPPELQPYLP
jgi:hypothetical protein